MALAFITWLWGTKYDATDVGKLVAAIRRHYRADFRFVVFSDRTLTLPPGVERFPIANPELTGRGCFCRLRMFDPAWQKWCGFDDRIVSLDLDLVFVANVEPVFARHETFVILQDVNAVNPCPFNCSLMMLRAGHHGSVWTHFTPEKANAVRFHEFPDDQAWIWHKLPDAAGWKPGKESGVYAFQKRGWPPGTTELPPAARIVSFFGWRKPKLFTHLPWIEQHWKE